MAEELWLQLQPSLPGFTVEVLPEVDSTNSELMRRARTGHIDPILLVAESQTAGRGRQGRTWISAPGDCLMYSLGLMMNPADWSGLSLVVGLSIAESLQANSRVETAAIGVKWPNDLWLADGKKLGGTLIETANVPSQSAATILGNGPGNARFVILGTGINVRPLHAPDAKLSTPAACLQELNPDWSAPSALHHLLEPLFKDIQTFAHHGFAPFVQRFAQRDVLRGKEVHLSDGRTGMAVGVSSDGSLQLQMADGIHAIVSGEVSVRPLQMALPRTAD